MTLFLRRSVPRNLYDTVSEDSAAVVISQYSSSFGVASRLLAEPVRTQVRNIYALVRVADEIVDNPSPDLAREARERMLTWLLEDVRHALVAGYSANLVVHAFARTALSVGIEDDVVEPFFASMRMDLDTTTHTPATFDRYVYGSAEVVGLMCLRAFVAAPDGPADPAAAYDALSPGARRLGAAFQKLNFLRDLADDHDLLHRTYFPGLDPDRFCDADRDRILDDIDADLAAASAVVPELPPSSRRAVSAAHATFAELSSRLRRTSAQEIRRSRVRVPTAVKLRIAAGAVYGGRS
ncbi:Phytoene/squalene synthetase [Nocardioides alpinus]|uniref:Phytoene synthase n=1 Tax=Nocardioides alpinus TaxID=748909 RepID=A0A1I1AWH1_9ACTN|nr:squalene/phytoene synthase family protein [Nocardioides alpinus]PKH40963.1 phytoene synthase [Nocardioides alpinus]SFB42439.1 Phytoene/squalene synthetase [Nocardioides alpinus]